MGCDVTCTVLLPVTRVIVRGSNASYLETFVLAEVLALSDQVDDELMVKTIEEGLVRHLGLEERNIDTGDLLHDGIHLYVLDRGCTIFTDGERNLVDVVDVEVRPAVEQGVPDGNLVLDGKDEVLVSLLIEFVEISVCELALCGFLNLVGVGDCEGVILRADLHQDDHLASLVELLESVERCGELVVDALVGDLEVTDVLELLDSHLLPGVDVLFKPYRLHDSVVDLVHEEYAYECKHEAENRFQCLVHYP